MQKGLHLVYYVSKYIQCIKPHGYKQLYIYTHACNYIYHTQKKGSRNEKGNVVVFDFCF